MWEEENIEGFFKIYCCYSNNWLLKCFRDVVKISIFCVVNFVWEDYNFYE